MPVAWRLADAKSGEGEVAAKLLDMARETTALRVTRIVLADKGLAGWKMERCAEDGGGLRGVQESQAVQTGVGHGLRSPTRISACTSPGALFPISEHGFRTLPRRFS